MRKDVATARHRYQVSRVLMPLLALPLFWVGVASAALQYAPVGPST